MATLNLFLQMIGDEPTEWFDTDVKFKDGVWFAGQSQKKSVAAHDGLFRQQLAERVWKLFDATLKSGKSMFDGVTATSISAGRAHEIQDRDLLCYVCSSKNRSVVKNTDRQAFDEAAAKGKAAHPTHQLDGITVPLPRTGTGRLCSEVYLDQGGGVNIHFISTVIYHEWMHNKTNWAGGEDADWPHKLDGIAVPGGAMKGLTPLVMSRMLAHLSNANRQFIAAIP